MSGIPMFREDIEDVEVESQLNDGLISTNEAETALKYWIDNTQDSQAAVFLRSDLMAIRHFIRTMADEIKQLKGGE